MIIDSHQHFWKFDPVRDSWIDETMSILRRDFLPQDLAPFLTENRIDGTIAVQADQSETETNFLLDLADQNEWIHGVVGWVDLCNSEIEKKLSYFSTKNKLRGFRHIVQSEPDDNFMLNPAFQNGIGLLNKYGFTYDILIYSKQIPAAIQLVQKYPEQTFILDHIAKPDIKNHKMEPWATEIKKLAGYQNVYCKVSGMITEANHNSWTKEEIYPYLDIVFSTFGVNRLLFGSDWPVCLLAGTYEKVVNLIKEYIAGFSPEEKEKLFGGSTLKAYGIN